jgi:7,8-dihydropterin-6-yl-methyl-4-(beta-D-ribofuranosyl)aminobenzene 5'-phosphate synthase
MLKKPLKITFLVDDMPGPGCRAEHGLSIFVEADVRILFDAGQSHLFLENAGILGVDTATADYLILSHGHYDHGNGFAYMASKRLICHSGSFVRRYRAKKSAYIGLKFDRKYADANFDLVLIDKPFKISDAVTFLGEIPRENDFEAKQTTFVLENGQPDFVIDDSAMVIDTPAGLIIIAGCSHAGICNIIEYARKVTGKQHVAAVVGGFHLKEGSPVIEPTINYLKTADIDLLMPCHCVDKSVIDLFASIFNCELVFAGKVKEFFLG